MRGGAADIESRRFQDARALSEIVLRSEIQGHGNSRGRSTGDQKCLGEFGAALGLSFARLRGEIRVQINDSAETRRRVEEPGGSKIQARDVKLGVEWSKRSVLLIDGAKCSVEFELAAAGQIRSDRHGKFRGDGNIRGGDVHVIIGAALLRIGRAHDDAAVAQREFCNGNFGARRSGRFLRGRLFGLRLGGGSAERRIVPLAGAVVQQGHLGAGNCNARDVQRLGEN